MNEGPAQGLVSRQRAERHVRYCALGLAYLLLFGLTHRFATWWGGLYFYSMLYPSAGVRMAFLWVFGAAWTPVITVLELVANAMSGQLTLRHGPLALADEVMGIMRPPIIYGIVVALAKLLQKRGRWDVAQPPMPFALAMVLAPLLATAAAFAYQAVRPGGANVPETQSPALVASAFLLGDLLGVLLIAPPFIWWAGRRRTSGPVRIANLPIAECAAILGLAWLASFALQPATGRLYLAPVLLATAWTGLRCGTQVVWCAILTATVIVLPISALETEGLTRLALHMDLAVLAVAGYLAGSFADAKRRAAQDIARRDRLLFQAERLKSLRAMSVSVIHEVSQPLSILLLEARHLSRLAARQPGETHHEIASSAALVEAKLSHIAEMVRRLRRFGGREIDSPKRIAVQWLANEAASLLRSEFPDSDGALTVDVGDVLFTFGREIELVQALVNLLRNALAAANGRSVRLSAVAEGETVHMTILNAFEADGADYPGMGLGFFIARTIIEAHGGSLHLDRNDGTARCDIRLTQRETAL